MNTLFSNYVGDSYVYESYQYRETCVLRTLYCIGLGRHQRWKRLCQYWFCVGVLHVSNSVSQLSHYKSNSCFNYFYMVVISEKFLTS